MIKNLAPTPSKATPMSKPNDLADKIYSFIFSQPGKEASLNEVMVATKQDRRKIGFILNTDDRFVQQWETTGVKWAIG